MIAYIESNFVLEMALEQEETDHAKEILDLAEHEQVELVIPAFSLSEPFSAVMHKGNERVRLCDQLNAHLQELSRSQAHKTMASQFQVVPTALLAIEREEINRLVMIIQRLLASSRRIEMTAASFDLAQHYVESYALSMQDAIIYATVIEDLRLRPPDVPKCFLSRNSRDFYDPSIITELNNYNCKYLPRFASGLEYIKSKIRQ